MKKNTNLSIETLRGITILFVVIGHVIGSTSEGGMRVDDSSIYRYFYALLENIRMPLFTVISGWVYSLHPVSKNSAIFLLKKARRLLLPMIFVGTTYFIIQNIIPGVNNKSPFSEIWKIYIFPYTLFWYLPALFLIFTIISIVDQSKYLYSFKKWISATIIAWIICLCELSHIIPESIINIFAFKNALYLMPFFLLGLGLNRFGSCLNTPKLRIIYLIATILGIVLQQIHYFNPLHFSLYQKLYLSIPIGMFSSAFLITLDMKNYLLIQLSNYAYSIYLFHGFGTSGGRIILSALGIHNQLIIFIVATFIATVAPILVDKVLSKNRYSKLLFLGKSK